MRERLQAGLIKEALDARQKKASVEQARQEIGGLYKSLEELMPNSFPPIFQRKAYVNGESYTDRSTFSIPVEDGQNVDVTIQRREVYEMKDAFLVDLPDLNYIAVITPSGGYIESKAHNRAPFTMHTPMGSNSDRGPQWQREMGMETLGDYLELVALLQEVEPTSRERKVHYDNHL